MSSSKTAHVTASTLWPPLFTSWQYASVYATTKPQLKLPPFYPKVAVLLMYSYHLKPSRLELGLEILAILQDQCSPVN